MRRLITIVVSSSATSFLIGHQFSNWIKNRDTLLTDKSSVALQPSMIKDNTTTKTPSIVVEADKTEDNTEFWKKASRSTEIMKFGYPGFDNLRTFENFVLSYDRRMRTAHWVVEHLTPEKTVYNENVNRSKSEFKPDISIHPFFQSQNSDYFVIF